MKSVFLKIVLALAIVILIILSLMGYVPGLSTVLGATKPRDLGVTYTEEDTKSAIAKSGAQYDTLVETTPDNQSIQFSGSHEVNTSWNSTEMTALLNDRPWKYWPISNVQLRINPDNTVEISGVINSAKLKGYATGISVPSAVTDRISILPAQASFYLKGSGGLLDNKVSQFDITNAQLGHIPISPGLLLSKLTPIAIDTAYAESVTAELSKYSGKKATIVDFVNGRLSWISGFFAKKAQFSEGKLLFEGSIPDQESTVR